jgi:hypothetical protein
MMKINHTIAHYIIGGLALAMSSYGLVHTPARVITQTHEIAHSSHFAWPALGENKTIELGEALKKLPEQKVTLFCSGPSCQGLASDLDDALQIANWKSDLEARFVDSEADKGIFIGPPGLGAEDFAKAISNATGVNVEIVPIDGIEGIGIIIGKRVSQ